ncbi:MAG: hypothetical protein ACLR2O_05720, partial [Coprococcus sp.]
YANGWEVAYTYDSMDRVTQVKAVKGSSSYVIGQYLYDRQREGWHGSSMARYPVSPAPMAMT